MEAEMEIVNAPGSFLKGSWRADFPSMSWNVGAPQIKQIHHASSSPVLMHRSCGTHENGGVFYSLECPVPQWCLQGFAEIQSTGLNSTVIIAVLEGSKLMITWVGSPGWHQPQSCVPGHSANFASDGLAQLATSLLWKGWLPGWPSIWTKNDKIVWIGAATRAPQIAALICAALPVKILAFHFQPQWWIYGASVGGAELDDTTCIVNCLAKLDCHGSKFSKYPNVIQMSNLSESNAILMLSTVDIQCYPCLCLVLLFWLLQPCLLSQKLGSECRIEESLLTMPSGFSGKWLEIVSLKRWSKGGKNM